MNPSRNMVTQCGHARFAKKEFSSACLTAKNLNNYIKKIGREKSSASNAHGFVLSEG